MPQKSAPELFAVVHYLHRLSTEGKRGMKMARWTAAPNVISSCWKAF